MAGRKKKTGKGPGGTGAVPCEENEGGRKTGAGKKPKEEAGKNSKEETGKKPKAGKKAFKYPGRGAPRIYATAEELAKGCERYFASISVVEEAKSILTGKPEVNSLGKTVELVTWIMQPSMGALARSLGISDRTLRNYEQDEALAPVVEWAKGVCRDYLLEQVTTREKGSLNGLIFVLENNFGMREQLSVEHSGQRIEEYLAALEAGAEAAEF